MTTYTAKKIVDFKTIIPTGYTIETGFGVVDAAGRIVAKVNGSPMLFDRLRTAKAVAAGGFVGDLKFAVSA